MTSNKNTSEKIVKVKNMIIMVMTNPISIE